MIQVDIICLCFMAILNGVQNCFLILHGELALNIPALLKEHYYLNIVDNNLF